MRQQPGDGYGAAEREASADAGADHADADGHGGTGRGRDRGADGGTRGGTCGGAASQAAERAGEAVSAATAALRGEGTAVNQDGTAARDEGTAVNQDGTAARDEGTAVSGRGAAVTREGAAEPEPVWRGLPRSMLTLRRLLLAVWMLVLAVAAGLLLGLLAGPAWAAFAALPLGLLLWGWPLLGRNWHSWRYAERADDLLIQRGVLWRQETIVPYGRMQLVEVESGPLQRKFGLASLQLHTAAAATDAAIPGLDPSEAQRLRDRLTELGEARSAGL